MRSSQLRPLQPFIAAVAGYAQALSRDVSSCRCTLSATGRWEAPASGCVGEAGCRQVLHIIVRVHLAQLRMPVDHLTDPELDGAVDELHTLCLRAAEVSVDDFAAGIQQALRAERVAVDAS